MNNDIDRLIEENLEFLCEMEEQSECDENKKKEYVKELMQLSGCTEDESQMAILKYWEDLNIVRQFVAELEATRPRCPTCSSTRIHKISALSKAGSVAMFGIFSQKVKRQFHCDNCGYEW